MANSLGVAYNFAFTGTDGIVISGTGIGTLTLQDAEYSKEADRYEVKDAAGVTKNVTFENPSEKATLSYLPRGSGLADALTQTTIPAQGVIITITTCASLPALVASTWFSDGAPKINKSNTDFAKVSLPLSKFPGITAATSA